MWSEHGLRDFFAVSFKGHVLNLKLTKVATASKLCIIVKFFQPNSNVRNGFLTKGN